MSTTYVCVLCKHFNIPLDFLVKQRRINTFELKVETSVFPLEVIFVMVQQNALIKPEDGFKPNFSTFPLL